MLEALLIAAVVVAALSCPVMMWLGRRGIGPGCAMMGCASEKKSEETLDDLRRRKRELTTRISQLEGEEARTVTAAHSGGDQRAPYQ